MNEGFSQKATYWDEKLSAYLHDPPDKALRIPGHQERSQALREVLGPLPLPDPDLLRRADTIAAGMDRTTLPGYDRDASQDGSVDFSAQPVLTHPTAERADLTISLGNGLPSISAISAKIQELMSADIDRLCDQFPGDPQGLSPARFHYVHHVLRERLRKENVGGLGGLWDRLPADTRIPDHSIWQHCGLVSALYSCFAAPGSGQASLMVVSLTPVQGFIEKTRKLRDLWVGSMILSWLAFEGIRTVIYRLGSDHVLYPSLIGQPLVDDLLRRTCLFSALEGGADGSRARDAATFPNKFVCLVPQGSEHDIAGAIQSRIGDAWSSLGQQTLLAIEKAAGTSGDRYIQKQFHRQMDGYWTFRWSASPLLDETHKDQIKTLLPADVWEQPIDFVNSSKKLPYSAGGKGAFYSVTHAIAQTFLAAGKQRQLHPGPAEDGIKCQLHGDMEALRFEWKAGEDQNPRPGQDPFWVAFKKGWNVPADFRATERLCSVATVKRIAGQVIRKNGDGHPLETFFRKADTFPSTTEMAFSDWLDTVRKAEPVLVDSLKKLSSWRNTLSQYIHDTDESEMDGPDRRERLKITSEERRICKQIVQSMERRKAMWTDADRYYAILLMDGDRMGKLVAGETMPATWRTIIHPGLIKRLEDGTFNPAYRQFWLPRLDHKRMISPSVHAAISEALGDFSLYTVPRIIQQCRGRLIYAGGDDVCAILPISTAIYAARDIARLYRADYVAYRDDRNSGEPVSGTWVPEACRIGLHMGRGEGISISGSVLICHHKRPLSSAMAAARTLLKAGAKKEGGRNAIAVQVDKRSGGPRGLIRGWDEQPMPELMKKPPKGIDPCQTIMDHFLSFAEDFGANSQLSMSSSLIYRMEDFRDGLTTLARQKPAGLPDFLSTLIVRSDRSLKNNKEGLQRLAWRAAALLLSQDGKLQTETLVVARFIGPQLARYHSIKGE